MKHLITYMTTLMLFTIGCRNSTNINSDKQIVNEWLGQHIELPDTLTDVRTNKTIRLKDSQFTIISYIDDDGCISCKMELPLWTEYIRSINTKSNKKINTILLINSNNLEEAYNAINYYKYKHIVCVDWGEKIYLRNKIPTKSKYQTFLLDSLHNVIVIGNPNTNSKIKDLYNQHFDYMR